MFLMLSPLLPVCGRHSHLCDRRLHPCSWRGIAPSEISRRAHKSPQAGQLETDRTLCGAPSDRRALLSVRPPSCPLSGHALDKHPTGAVCTRGGRRSAAAVYSASIRVCFGPALTGGRRRVRQRSHNGACRSLPATGRPPGPAPRSGRPAGQPDPPQCPPRSPECVSARRGDPD